MSSAPRNIVDNDQLLIRPVDDFTIFTGFSCALADLDRFIRSEAKGHADELLAVTYACHLKGEGDIVSLPVAFISLANDSVVLKTGRKKKLFRRAKHYDGYPAVKITRLGVHCEYQRNKIGSHILHSIKQLFITDNRTGCRFLTVDAYNSPPVISFYEKNDFEPLLNGRDRPGTHSMFFDLKRLALTST